ncbi:MULTISPECIES: hypothetical protein [unclassified Adlercreutzia]|uniref:hypothetical protein n=1 Tax=unclassified Adlercreutzia TaxID=2636013 RepID=UPI0013EE1D2D|nr:MULTISPECIES: hypothetical protein [unclassified Adlercreutzia]
MSAEQGSRSESERPPYEVKLSEAAEIIYRDLAASSAFPKVKKMLELLDTVPEIGRVYDPDYPAARPDVRMRVTYADRCGIYYVVEEHPKLVRVLFIEDQRRNPLNRFYGIYPYEEEPTCPQASQANDAPRQEIDLAKVRDGKHAKPIKRNGGGFWIARG